MKKLLISQKLQSSICLLENDKVVISVSGGVDSITLLNYIIEKNQNIEIYIIYFDYKTRGEDNTKEYEIINNIAIKNNIKLIRYECNYNEIVGNFQSQARSLRYENISNFCKREKIKYIFTAHTANDVIETYFIKRIQNRNKVNVTIKYKSEYKGIIIIRPFIELYKKDIIEYAKTNNYMWVEDLSNKSGKYLRNRIRKKIDIIPHNTLNKWLKEINTLQSHKEEVTDIFEFEITKILEMENYKEKIYYSLNKNNIFKRKNFILEVIKLLNGENKSRQLKVDDKRYLVIVNNKIKIFYININLERFIYNGSIYLDNINIKTPKNTLVKLRKCINTDVVLKNEGWRKIHKELKNKKIPQIIRKNTYILLNESNKIIYIQYLNSDYKKI